MDMRVIEVTDFKLEVRFDLWDNLESNIGKLPLQVMRGSPLVTIKTLTKDGSAAAEEKRAKGGQMAIWEVDDETEKPNETNPF